MEQLGSEASRRSERGGIQENALAQLSEKLGRANAKMEEQGNRPNGLNREHNDSLLERLKNQPKKSAKTSRQMEEEEKRKGLIEKKFRGDGS